MPDDATHLTRAEQAFDEAESMRSTSRWRWASVAYFYAAMHAVHSAFPSMVDVPLSLKHPEAHTGPDGTLTVVRRHLPGVFAPYFSLFSTSVDVRYNGLVVAQGLIEQHRYTDLPVIGAWVCKHLHGLNCAGCWMSAL
ncbi:MAG TPA: hypothetical protein VFT67_17690 [Jatrophihabitantaceae bacterium]|nr:hypothetical protein [Jatrophihabitantaceae bacterium]